MLVDEADLLDAGRLDKDQTETAERVAAEMHDMEGPTGVAGLGAVMDHRRHDQAVFQCQPANGERLKKLWACGLATVGWSITSLAHLPATTANMPRKQQLINCA
jgi:hypothetical protein